MAQEPQKSPIEHDELKDLAVDILSTNIRYIKGAKSQLEGIDKAIERATEMAGRCSLPEEFQKVTSSITALSVARSQIIEQQTVLLMASAKPLRGFLAAISDEESEPDPAAFNIKEDDPQPASLASLGELQKLVSELESVKFEEHEEE